MGLNMDNSNSEIKLEHSLKFMLAGKSEFILHSSKTGEYFEYYLTKKASMNNENEFIYFLNTKLSGKKVYAGVLWYDNKVGEFKFSKGQKGEVDNNHLNIRSLLFVLNKLNSGGVPQYCTVYHTGTCGRCGRKLTTPESILTGLGPECSKKVGIPRVKIKNKGK